MIPEMVSHGYNKPFSAALTAAAGTIGVIIPPSIPFVIYGVVSGTSITDLFTAGFLPGIMMGIALMVVCYFVSKKNGYRGKEKASTRLRYGRHSKTHSGPSSPLSLSLEESTPASSLRLKPPLFQLYIPLL